MNDTQKKILVWGSAILFLIFLFPPHESIYTDDTSYSFLFSKANDAYQIASGKWIFHMIIVIAVIFGGISSTGQRDSK